MTLKLAPGTKYAAILGFGGYRPRRVVDNAEICTLIDSTDEWIRTRSGIVEAPLGVGRGDRPDDVGGRRPQRGGAVRDRDGPDRRGDRLHGHPPAPDPVRRRDDRRRA